MNLRLLAIPASAALVVGVAARVVGFEAALLWSAPALALTALVPPLLVLAVSPRGLLDALADAARPDATTVPAPRLTRGAALLGALCPLAVSMGLLGGFAGLMQLFQALATSIEAPGTAAVARGLGHCLLAPTYGLFFGFVCFGPLATALAERVELT